MGKTIKSDSATALTELKAKAEKLRAEQETMKAANAYFRHNCTMQGFGDWTDEQAAKADAAIQGAYAWNKQPYPAYLLQNNGQNLRETERRIMRLEQELDAVPKEYDTEKFGFTVEENKDIMRLQISFLEKPEKEIREQLQGQGFKWAPSKDCWQRLLNSNARYALDRFVRFMQRQQQSEPEMG